MVTAVLLGVFHGVNPAMGWLFAVFLALHRQRRAELWRSLVPITLGHGLSVALVVALVAVARSTLPVQPVRYVSAVLVLAFGIYRVLRWYRHPSAGGGSGLNMSYRDLAVWAFLGATSHGSGLMLTPLLFGGPAAAGALAVVAVHTVTMLLVMLGVAILVHDRLMLQVLRRYWFNFDLLWAGGLVLAGLLLLAGAVGHSHG